MNILFATILLAASIGCTSEAQAPHSSPETAMLDLLKTNDELYDLKLHIEHGKNGVARLVATIDFFNGSYTASPLSNNNFTGLFTVALDASDKLKLDEAIEETPRSVETFDVLENVPVNWVQEKTTYKRILHIGTQKDFEVSGLVSFTIEPRCTFEKVLFTLSQRLGELRVKQ